MDRLIPEMKVFGRRRVIGPLSSNPRVVEPGVVDPGVVDPGAFVHIVPHLPTVCVRRFRDIIYDATSELVRRGLIR